MPDIVRVRGERTIYNEGRAKAVAKGLEVLDEPTHDRGGKPLPPTRLNGRALKPRTTVNASRRANKTSAAKKATTKKAAQSAKKSDTAPSKES